MAKVITQETFDDAVTENITEFSMSLAEARQETVEQFEAQGINLANIVKDLTIDEQTGRPVITETLEKLAKHINDNETLSDETLHECLDAVRAECEKSVPHRVLAAKKDALTLISHFAAPDKNVETLTRVLAALAALIYKQPDIFDENTLRVLAETLQRHSANPKLVKLALTVLSRACVMHETNRQNIMQSNALRYLLPLMTNDDPSVITHLCTVYRSLILDDDVRVEFGKAHDHAKAIATETLADLTGMIDKFGGNAEVQSELIITVAALTVRNEYCTLVEEAGGLKYVLAAMKSHADNVKLVRDGLQLLKALAGNDVVKARIIEQGGAPLITDILCIHKANEALARISLMCLATLTLRSKDNSQALFETGIVEEIVETMRLHSTSKFVQRNAAWAIRNMVSRSRDQCPQFLERGVERVLNEAMAAHPSVAQDIKSALRDLNCDVTLKEEWTGLSTIKMAN